MEDGNIRAAVRILFSDDQIAEHSADTLQKLQSKHPPAPADREPCENKLPTSIDVTEGDVGQAIRSFPSGSSGGPYGFRPQHLSDMVKDLISGPTLLTALTSLVNSLLSGFCCPMAARLLFGGRLIALSKKSGGIRPIAVGFVLGFVLRRLTAKCACLYARDRLAEYFAPHQLGVCVKGGCEAAVHAVRRYLQNLQPGYVIAKLDFSNAFNCIRRDAMLSQVLAHIPELYKFCRLSYENSSVLWFGSSQIFSSEGTQQGDPLGPLLFCLTIHPLLLSLQSELNLGYMDDLTLGGDESTVEDDIGRITDASSKLGLHLNRDKCEVIHQPGCVPKSPIFQPFIHLVPDVACLLGAALLFGPGLDSLLHKHCETLATATDRLSTIGRHDALILLRACFGASKLQYVLRTSPCFEHPALSTLDDLLRSGLSAITNCSLSDSQWIQACLPVRDGGLGVRDVTSLAIPAFLASAASTLELQDAILATASVPQDTFVPLFTDIWSSLFSIAPPALLSAR